VAGSGTLEESSIVLWMQSVIPYLLVFAGRSPSFWLG
jgi:hypothetical protein